MVTDPAWLSRCTEHLGAGIEGNPRDPGSNGAGQGRHVFLPLSIDLRRALVRRRADVLVPGGLPHNPRACMR